jgi:hypothetical protein
MDVGALCAITATDGTSAPYHRSHELICFALLPNRARRPRRTAPQPASSSSYVAIEDQN